MPQTCNDKLGKRATEPVRAAIACPLLARGRGRDERKALATVVAVLTILLQPTDLLATALLSLEFRNGVIYLAPGHLDRGLCPGAQIGTHQEVQRGLHASLAGWGKRIDACRAQPLTPAELTGLHVLPGQVSSGAYRFQVSIGAVASDERQQLLIQLPTNAESRFPLSSLEVVADGASWVLRFDFPPLDAKGVGTEFKWQRRSRRSLWVAATGIGVLALAGGMHLGARIAHGKFADADTEADANRLERRVRRFDNAGLSSQWLGAALTLGGGLGYVLSQRQIESQKVIVYTTHWCIGDQSKQRCK